MNVIELSIDFSVKDKSSNIDGIIGEAYKENGQEVALYKRKIRKEWGNQTKGIQTLNNCKNLCGYEICSERKYFLFRNSENRCVNGKGELKCIILASEDYNECKENIKLVVDRIRVVLKKKVSININFNTSCKIYICNVEENDIVSAKFYLNAKLEKERVWESKKKKINFVLVLLVFAAIVTAICWGQISEYVKSLTLAYEEPSKAIISAKISILVNLFTGIYGSILIEGLLVFYDIIVIRYKKDFTLNIDFDITKNNVEEHNRKQSTMHVVGENLESNLNITCDV